jgi:hypothetical protein
MKYFVWCCFFGIGVFATIPGILEVYFLVLVPFSFAFVMIFFLSGNKHIEGTGVVAKTRV